MKIQAQNFTIDLSAEELQEICTFLKSSLKKRIETHWVNHPEQWERQESKQIAIIKKMSIALGRFDIYEDLMDGAKNIFNSHCRPMKES